MTTRPSFRVAAREASAGLRGDDLRAWETGEYQRCVAELGRQIFEHDDACASQAERDDTNETAH